MKRFKRLTSATILSLYCFTVVVITTRFHPGNGLASWRHAHPLRSRQTTSLAFKRPLRALKLVVFVFLFCKPFEQYSQTNLLIIKTMPVKVTCMADI